MTVSSIVPVNSYTGNSSNTKFDFDFLIEGENELVVQHINENGTTTDLTLGVDYSINEVGNKNGSYITFPLENSSYSILKNEEKIVLMLSLEIEQESEFKNSSYFKLDVLEWALDYIVRILQILNRKIERCIKVGEGLSVTPDELLHDLNVSRDTAVAASQYAMQILENIEGDLDVFDQKVVDFENTYNDCYQSILDTDINTRTDINLSNLTSIGEKHFLNKTQITNCILETPVTTFLSVSNGVLTFDKRSTAIIPYGKSAPQKNIGDSLNGGTIVDISWDSTNQKLFYFVKYNQNLTNSYSSNATPRWVYVTMDGTLLSDINGFGGNTAPTSSDFSISSNGIWYDTANNQVKKSLDKGATWDNSYYSLPVGIAVSTVNVGVTKLQKVFQHIGHMGSAIWANKGIKTLIPNRRNDDDYSLKNKENVSPYVFSVDAANWGTRNLNILLLENTLQVQDIERFTQDFEICGTYIYTFSQKNNQWYYSSDSGTTWEPYYFTIIGDISVEGGNTTSNFNDRTPFHAVDSNEFAVLRTKSYITETYINGTSWYRVWSDGFCEQGGYKSDGTTTITLLKAFKDTNYSATFIPTGANSSNPYPATLYYFTKTTNAITLALGTYAGYWEAKGYIK